MKNVIALIALFASASVFATGGTGGTTPFVTSTDAAREAAGLEAKQSEQKQLEETIKRVSKESEQVNPNYQPRHG